ncbi:FlhC family transcriptional regulator [Simplicispira suum]|uniref:Flagellar transcriptional regulator FlhC n=1 Tax=Simplicispira suum TaxID=2109915 RepID=A0A2S0N5P1_9BURK|nr:FlhC family transcriptional regulator [Simplicispira suum]AVO43460.1 hypothetical protein C6571_18720 [Simplicispira suum]
MISVAELHAYNTATALVRRKLRLSLVTSLTGVSQRTLRGIWREIHGEGAPNGKLPEFAQSLITSRQIAASAAAFVSVYLQQYGPVKGAINAEHLMGAVDLSARFGNEVNIATAFYCLRDLKAGFLMFPKCCQCGARYLYDSSGGRHLDRCPFCSHAPLKR